MTDSGIIHFYNDIDGETVFGVDGHVWPIPDPIHKVSIGP